MLTTGDKPSIVIVQGAFQTPLAYQNLLTRLQSRGYSVVHPTLPRCTNPDDPDFPTRTLTDDAVSVRRHLTRLVRDEHNQVVVVMHSYGGLVGIEAVTEDLTYKERLLQGMLGGVIYLYYITAVVLAKDSSVLGTFGESPNNDVQVSTTLVSQYLSPFLSTVF
jgi:alpha-beta hydrolase superfamily lysophospholipase